MIKNETGLTVKNLTNNKVLMVDNNNRELMWKVLVYMDHA